MLERLSWKALVWGLFLFCLPAFVLSLFIGHLPWLLVVSLLSALIWHAYNLMKLSKWLWLDRSVLPPEGKGGWEPIFYGIRQTQQRNRKRRRELGDLIKRFRSGAESLPDAVVMITNEGNIFWCNSLAQHLLGFRWPDDNGQNIFNLLRYPDFLHYFTVADFSRPLTIALNNGAIVEFRVMPYADEQRLMVARDVTEKNKLENSRRDFFANVSHELRTPLTVIQGYLEMMEENTAENPAEHKVIKTMQEQAKRMDLLVQQLLQLSRIESAPHIDLNTVVDMPALLSVLEHDAHSLSQEQQNIIFDIDHKWAVRGNEEQLRSAVSNLVYNAINHTPEGTTIRVSWKKVPQGMLFSVSDNGPGISAEHLTRLTERFYRVDKARSRHTGGTGLGLAIVKKSLQHHHSILNIESKVGVGSTFSFIMPQTLLTEKK